MARLMYSLMFSLTLVVPGLAFDTPQALMQAVYAPYVQADYDWSGYDDSAWRSKELEALFEQDAAETPEDQVGRLDFDPYVDGQDFDLSDLKIGNPAISGDAAQVEVTFKNFDAAEDLVFSLVHESDGWKIDDIVSSNPDYQWSLKQIMSAPMPTDDDGNDSEDIGEDDSD